MIRSARRTVNPSQTHRVENQAVRHRHVSQSIRPPLSAESKEGSWWMREKGRREGWSWSLVDWFSLNCHVRVPDCTRQAPLSTQSPSLRAGWTASPAPRWMLAASACLASTRRCRAAGFNWQQKKKRLRAAHDMPAFPLGLFCSNQSVSPPDNVRLRLVQLSV